MEFIANINSAINGVVRGPPMLILLMGAGILPTCRAKGIQVRKLGYVRKNTVPHVLHLSGVVVKETKRHFEETKETM